MRNRVLIVILVLVAMLALSFSAFAQRGGGRGQQAATAAAASNAPFDHHDISGVWTRNPQTFDKSAPPCPECRKPASGYGFSEQVPEFTPEGQKGFDANKTGKGWAPDSPQAKANPQVHIGRRRGVPPGLANDPQATCNPDGIPRLLLMTPAPYEILMTPERMFEFFEWTWAHREVWTDGRKLPEKLDYVPRWFGYSAGKWEGDTFRVESIGFDDRSWVDSFGYPHSDQMKLVEEYKLRDHDTLELKITLIDPVIYKTPWVTTKVNKRVPKDKLEAGGWSGIVEDICAPLDEVDTFNRLIRDPAAGIKK